MKKIIFLLNCLLAIITVSNAQTIYTIAGTGSPGYNGDNISSSSAQIFYPTGVACDTAGNIYISDQVNNRIRKIAPSGLITTVAGTGVAGFSGDGGLAVNAKLNGPYDVFVDMSGNIYIADQGNKRIRKVNTAGVITTVAGTGTSGYNGDGIAATTAQLNNAYAVAADNAGNIYISDVSNYRVRKVNTSGIISTYAGTGISGFSGDGGPAVSAKVAGTGKMCFDASGNLIVIDVGNNVVRKISTGGTITTIAGSGSTTFGGDGGPATSAGLNNPLGVCIDTAGNLYISDYNHFRIRKVNTGGTITTIAGTGTSGYSGDGGIPTSAMMIPHGLVMDKSNSLIITDINNHRIRRIVNPCVTPSAPASTTPAAALNKCYGQTTTLSVLDPGLISWYSVPSGGSSLGTGFTFTTPALLANITYYAETRTCATSASRTSFSINVNSNPVVNSSNDTMICRGMSLVLNGSGALSYAWTGGIANGVSFSPSASATYTVTGTDVNGCTATASTLVTVTIPDTLVYVTGANFIANSGTGSFQWYNCSTSSVIPGETSYTFNATASGSYALIITENGCVDTSSCYSVSFTGITDHAPDDFLVFPDPASAWVNVIMPDGDHTIRVRNMLGQEVKGLKASGKAVIDVSGLEPGLYQLEITGNGHRFARMLSVYH